ncbi:MAG: hypothetical protein MAG453_01436 [Calditrichaeota bacterium]|nr:hypothetical protein [Calditrichota bacterium]
MAGFDPFEPDPEVLLITDEVTVGEVVLVPAFFRREQRLGLPHGLSRFERIAGIGEDVEAEVAERHAVAEIHEQVIHRAVAGCGNPVRGGDPGIDVVVEREPDLADAVIVRHLLLARLLPEQVDFALVLVLDRIAEVAARDRFREPEVDRRVDERLAFIPHGAHFVRERAEVGERVAVGRLLGRPDLLAVAVDLEVLERRARIVERPRQFGAAAGVIDVALEVLDGDARVIGGDCAADHYAEVLRQAERRLVRDLDDVLPVRDILDVHLLDVVEDVVAGGRGGFRIVEPAEHVREVLAAGADFDHTQVEVVDQARGLVVQLELRQRGRGRIGPHQGRAKRNARQRVERVRPHFAVT